MNFVQTWTRLEYSNVLGGSILMTGSCDKVWKYHNEDLKDVTRVTWETVGTMQIVVKICLNVKFGNLVTHRICDNR